MVVLLLLGGLLLEGTDHSKIVRAYRDTNSDTESGEREETRDRDARRQAGQGH